MSEIATLLKNWGSPLRSPEKTQVTLRMPLDDYHRLLALKEIYPNRSVNDMVVDIVEAALNDIIVKLPVGYYTEQDIKDMEEENSYCGEEPGQAFGLGEVFNQALFKIQNKHNAEKNSADKTQQGVDE